MSSGYFHSVMEQMSQDLLAGRDPLTKLWGEFFKEFETIAYSIASSEACDSGPYDPILETISRLPALQRRLDEIKQFIDPYRRVAEEAVRNKAKKGDNFENRA